MHLKYTEILPTIVQENIRNLQTIPLNSDRLSLVNNIFNNKNSTLQLLFLFHHAVNIYKNAMTAPQSIKIKSLFRNRLKLFPEYQEKNLSEQRRDSTTNSTHIWRRRRDLNPGNIGGRRALPPLRHPFLPLIAAEQQDCPVFIKFLTKKTSYQNISNTFLVWFCSNVRISGQLLEE